MANINIGINPYILGKQINKPEEFFGREELFQFIEDSLNSDIKFILLHGQRRIGKSSVLKQFAHKVALQKFVFVYFDLQNHSNSSVSHILLELAEEITEKLGLDSDIITLSSSDEELNTNPNRFSHEFLPKVYQKLGDKNLVLLLDEFDIVNSDNGILSQENNIFFIYLKSLLKQQKKLFIIPVVGRFKDDFQNLHKLFNSPPYQEVGLLNEISARRLIIKPAQGILEYQEDAIKAILKLSAGHPYFTQAICFNLFLQAKIEEKSTVTSSDVQSIVDKAIESATGGLSWFWDGLSISEQVVFSAVAKAQKIAIDRFPEDPLTLLKKYGVLQTEPLTEATKKLARKGYLDDTERRVKIELVRRWLVQCHSLNQEIYKLEEFETEEINNLLQKVTQLSQNGKIQDVIDCYEEIFKLNPNHFSTLPILAERYLDLEVPNFEKALELYMRAYQVDRIRNKEGLLLAREAYGKNLIEQRELIKAKIQFEGVLEIEPDRNSAQQQLRKIKAELVKQEAPQRRVEEQLMNDHKKYSKTLIRQRLILGAIAAIILVGGGIAVYRFLKPCSSGQEKVNGNCVSPPSNISRGDRTFFFTIPNTSRDQGIEAFKEGNYPQAAALFQNAVKDTNNKPDPEVLIYYNNAKAREKGNSLTLAVVVPADNSQDATQEILRGVAQAQNQFNVNGGSNGRLLEISIANDSNDPKKAEQVAQQLVNDKSVLGVIGHDSSEATQAALPIYKQAGIPIISATSTANSLNGRNFFRTIASDAASGEKLAQYATKSLLNKVVIFYNPKSPYSNSLREEFTKKFRGQIFRKIDLTDPTLNIEQELKESASQKVQAVMLFPDVHHTSRAIEIAKINTNNNLGLKLLGGESLYNQQNLNEGNKAVEGLILAVPWFRKAPQSKKFAKSAEDYWKGGVSWSTATSFDATKAFIKSLSFNPSRQSILARLPMIELSSEETSGDIVKFNKEGERQSQAILVRVEKGHFQCLQCSP
ncbi:MAG: ABC transporter substrate-binding protein [Nostoc sp.]|uniref:ABC transporter substrate-binding protein n=1 Tax=Nostoc sp. TaxID=1180 RepID=UPI002FFB36EE